MILIDLLFWLVVCEIRKQYNDATELMRAKLGPKLGK